MDVVSFMNAVILSGLTYDFVKTGTVLTASSIIAKVKDKTISWVIDEVAAEQLAVHINQLGTKENESLEQFEDRLKNDDVLKALIAQLGEGHHVRNITGDHTKYAERDLIDRSTHYYAPTDSTPKKS